MIEHCTVLQLRGGRGFLFLVFLTALLYRVRAGSNYMVSEWQMPFSVLCMAQAADKVELMTA